MVNVNPKDIEKMRREKLAGFFYDLAKLTFSALVIGIIVLFFTADDASGSLAWLVCGGLLFTVLCAVIANKILK